MSRRKVLQRKQSTTSQSSPTQVSRPEIRREVTGAELPPYKPPYFPLSAVAKRKLEELYLHHDFTKYKKNIKEATNILTKTAYESNDRLWQRKQKLRLLEEKMKTSEHSDERFEARYKIEKNHLNDFKEEVEVNTSTAEKALRDLIDYGDELSMQSHFLQTVAAKQIAKPNAPDLSTQPLSSVDVTLYQDSSSHEQIIQRCTEILTAVKTDYRTQYENKSKKERYADHNDYKNFKGMIHDAQNQEPNARPLENPMYWFPDESSHPKKTTEDDEDNEIIMTSATTNLKCSFTLQYFKEPYSNRKCKHTYEKSAILDYLSTESARPITNGRHTQSREKRNITCPTPGCSVTLVPDDFFLDERIQQQVVKAKRFEELGNIHDDESDERDVERIE